MAHKTIALTTELRELLCAALRMCSGAGPVSSATDYSGEASASCETRLRMQSEDIRNGPRETQSRERHVQRLLFGIGPHFSRQPAASCGIMNGARHQ